MPYSFRPFLTRLIVLSVSLASPVVVGGQSIMTMAPRTCPGTGYLFTTDYTEAGFTLVAAPGYGLGSWCAAGANYAGPGIWISAGGTATLSKDGGGTFSINAIELAHQNPGEVPAQSFTFTGNLFGGGTVMQTFTIGAQLAGPPTFTPFLFDATWTNLISVDFATQVPEYYQFTNILLDGAAVVIPEPASMALLGTGLVGIFGAMRRRRKQSA